MRKENQTQLKKSERDEIAVLQKKGYSIREIAFALGRGKSSIADELKRNSVKGRYDSGKAQQKAYVRRKYAKYQGMKIADNLELREYVEEKLQEDWSPEEIAGRIKKVDKHILYASYKVIYKFVSSVYGRHLERYLRYKHAKKTGGSRLPVTKWDERKFIDDRPKIVARKGRFGDWEGDFIVSGKHGKGILLVLHERKARYVLLKKIVGVTADAVYDYIAELTGGVVMNTLTLDNDIIFRKHKELSKLLGVPVYFCHPYHSWEKGGVENTNKLIRQYILKGSNISQYSDEYIHLIQDKLNNRPRKCLKYKTPLEVMLAHHQLKSELHAIIKLFTRKQKNTSLHVSGFRG